MKILNIITSPAGENSFSIKLANAIIGKLQSEKPDSSIKIRNLAVDLLPHFDAVHLNSLYIPTEDHTLEMTNITAKTDELISELLEADVVVIGVPMYNFGIPSTLKSWIDFITKPGKTFNYTENGHIGLIPDKRIFLAISTGDIYSNGALKMLDHTETYLRTILGDFLGMNNIKVIRLEGIALSQFKDTALEKALEDVSKQVTW